MNEKYDGASDIVVVGSVAFDSVETPFGTATDVIGGAATFFAVAASFFAPVKIVAVVGRDFPEAELDDLRSRGIDLEGVRVADGNTFRWHGRYHENLNVRDTLDLQLNVFADFEPELPDTYRSADVCFLANIAPALQGSVLRQLREPRLVGADTMNHWIEESRDNLVGLLAEVDLLTINDEEAFLLSKETNLVRAARKILEMGPKTLLVKRGEYGALHFSASSVFAAPAYPLEEVRDPTGAGDTFAGGLMGWLAKTGDYSEENVRRGIVYGSVMASFVVEDFSLNRLREIDLDDVEKRYREFEALTRF